MYQFFVATSVIPHQIAARSSGRSDRAPSRDPTGTAPKNADVRITTTVVAYTSLRDGHVTRRVSLRTSVMNVRLFSHQPRTPPSPVRTGAGLTCSNVLMVYASVIRALSSPMSATTSMALIPNRSSPVACWQVRRGSNPQPPVLETGALPIELLTYSLHGRGQMADRWFIDIRTNAAICHPHGPISSPCAPCAFDKIGSTC